MSWVSSGVKKLAKGAKKLVTDPKKWAENAGRSVGQGAKVIAPFLPPGARQLASVGGSIAAGGNMRDHITSGIGAEIGSMAGGRAAGSAIAKAGQQGGLTGIARALPAVLTGRTGAGGPTPPITSTAGRFTLPGFDNPISFPGAPNAGGGGGIDWGSILGQIGGFAKDNAVNIGLGGMAAAQALAAAKASARQGKLSDKAVSLAEERWASQRPLRERGIQQALNPTKADLSDVYHDPTNPFARKRPLPAIGSPPVITVPPPSPVPPNRLPPANPLPRNPAKGARPLITSKRPVLRRA